MFFHEAKEILFELKWGHIGAGDFWNDDPLHYSWKCTGFKNLLYWWVSIRYATRRIKKLLKSKNVLYRYRMLKPQTIDTQVSAVYSILGLFCRLDNQSNRGTFIECISQTASVLSVSIPTIRGFFRNVCTVCGCTMLILYFIAISYPRAIFVNRHRTCMTWYHICAQLPCQSLSAVIAVLTAMLKFSNRT